MDEEAGQYSHSVPTQLPAQCAGILHVQNLPGNKEDDPKGEVPKEEKDVEGGGGGAGFQALWNFQSVFCPVTRSYREQG